MPIKRALAALAVSMSLCASALAADVDCKDASDQATMNLCAGEDYKASDAKLNDVYRQLGKAVSEDGLAKLKTAQRAWIGYRDAQCAFDTAGTADGSVHPMIVSSCLDQLTQAQTRQLEAQLNCEEGDLSCGRQ